MFSYTSASTLPSKTIHNYIPNDTRESFHSFVRLVREYMSTSIPSITKGKEIYVDVHKKLAAASTSTSPSTPINCFTHRIIWLHGLPGIGKRTFVQDAICEAASMNHEHVNINIIDPYDPQLSSNTKW